MCSTGREVMQKVSDWIENNFGLFMTVFISFIIIAFGLFAYRLITLPPEPYRIHRSNSCSSGWIAEYGHCIIYQK